MNGHHTFCNLNPDVDPKECKQCIDLYKKYPYESIYNKKSIDELNRQVLSLARKELGNYKQKTVEELKKKMAEKDPNGKNPHELGAKLDTGKAPIFQGLVSYFPRACLAVSEVSAEGAKKYAWKGWISVPDGINRYTNAMIRHLCKEEIEGPIDADFGLLHAAHAAWNAMAVLELKLMEQEEQREAKLGNQGSVVFTRKEFGSDPNLSMGL